MYIAAPPHPMTEHCHPNSTSYTSELSQCTHRQAATVSAPTFDNKVLIDQQYITTAAIQHTQLDCDPRLLLGHVHRNGDKYARLPLAPTKGHVAQPLLHDCLKPGQEHIQPVKGMIDTRES